MAGTAREPLNKSGRSPRFHCKRGQMPPQSFRGQPDNAALETLATPDSNVNPCRVNRHVNVISRLRVILPCLYLMLSYLPIQASPCSTVVSGFDLRGIVTTQPRFLKLWSGLRKGQQVDQKTLNHARQRLMDTTFFQEVRVIAETPCSYRSRIVITVREKHYQLIYPRINRNGDGDLDLGIRYRGSNLLGRGQSLSVLLSRKSYANGNSAKRFRLEYDLPFYSPPYRLKGRLYQADTLIESSATLATETNRQLDVSLGRDWHLSWLKQPITVFALLGLQSKALDHPSPDLSLEDGVFNTLGLRLVYDDIHRDDRRRFGRFFSLSWQQGVIGLGSNYAASRLRFEGRHYQPINETDNINIRYILGFASDKIFNQNHFSIGGVATVRGIEPGSVSGNGLWLINLEYLKGFGSWPGFRIALFSDIANVFDRYDDFSGKPWQTTIGLGLRWHIRSFVKTDLFIDYGHDPDSGYSRFYAGTHLNF